MQKSEDLNYGLFSEEKVEPMIEEYFNEKVMNTKLTRGKWCAYDYETVDRQTRYELKTRRIKHNAYPTILINKSKITKGSSDGARLILLFLFEDGLYYIKYDSFIFSTFEEGDFIRYRDGHEEKSKVVHIPIKHLTRIDL